MRALANRLSVLWIYDGVIPNPKEQANKRHTLREIIKIFLAARANVRDIYTTCHSFELKE